jgi:hypothetical protein
MHRRLGPIVCLLICVAEAFASGQAQKQDRSWKAYENAQWGYCVSYPSRWVKGDAFDGAGIFVATGEKRFSRPIGEIDVGALPARAEGASFTLVEDRNAHLEGLKRFERAEGLEILDQHEMKIMDAPALFTKDRYFDPKERAAWVDEIIFTERKGKMYRLELECRADQVERFEPVFQMFISTFRFDCEGGP